MPINVAVSMGRRPEPDLADWSASADARLAAEGQAPDRSGPESRRVICEAIIDICAALFNVSGRELRLANRCTQGVARVRQIAMYLCHTTIGISLTEIGNSFGRDRTTVSHAVQLIEDLRDDADFDRVVEQVENVTRAAMNIGGVRL
jgi:chromosomal replication initiation ATPase DnaA